MEDSFHTLPVDESRLEDAASGVSQPSYRRLPYPSQRPLDTNANEVAALAREAERYTRLLQRFSALAAQPGSSPAFHHSDVEAGRTSGVAAVSPNPALNRSSLLDGDAQTGHPVFKLPGGMSSADPGYLGNTPSSMWPPFPTPPLDEDLDDAGLPKVQSLPNQGWKEANVTNMDAVSTASSVRLSPARKAALEAAGARLQRRFAQNQAREYAPGKAGPPGSSPGHGPLTSSPLKDGQPHLRFPTLSSSGNSNGIRRPPKGTLPKASRQPAQAPLSPRRPYFGTDPPFATYEDQAHADPAPAKNLASNPEKEYEELRTRLARLREDMNGKPASPRKADEPVFLQPTVPPKKAASKRQNRSQSRGRSHSRGRSQSRGRPEQESKRPDGSFVPAKAAMPFVAGKSTGATHSLGGNLQLLLSQLKTTCPLLYQAYLRHAKDARPVELQALFESELGSAISKASRRVDDLLRDYEAGQEHKAAALVAVEGAYAQLQRLRAQRRQLAQAFGVKPRCRGAGSPYRGQEALNRSAEGTSVRAPTVASLLHRSASAAELRERGEGGTRRRLVGNAALRDIKTLSKALSPRTA